MRKDFVKELIGVLIHLVVLLNATLDFFRSFASQLFQLFVAFRVVLLHPLPCPVSEHFVEHFHRVRLFADVDVPRLSDDHRVHTSAVSLSGFHYFKLLSRFSR